MFDVTINLDELLAFQQALTAMPEKVQSVLVETMATAQEMGWTALTDYPEPPPQEKGWLNSPGGSSPAWDSEKQRRAFFASNGFEGGIPYQRVGTLGASFEKSEIAASKELIEARVFSPEDWVRFVMGSGDQQSNIHKGRWQTDAQIGERIRPEIVELFSNNLLAAVKEALGSK